MYDYSFLSLISGHNKKPGYPPVDSIVVSCNNWDGTYWELICSSVHKEKIEDNRSWFCKLIGEKVPTVSKPWYRNEGRVRHFHTYNDYDSKYNLTYKTNRLFERLGDRFDMKDEDLIDFDVFTYGFYNTPIGKECSMGVDSECIRVKAFSRGPTDSSIPFYPRSSVITNLFQRFKKLCSMRSDTIKTYDYTCVLLHEADDLPDDKRMEKIMSALGNTRVLNRYDTKDIICNDYGPLTFLFLLSEHGNYELSTLSKIIITKMEEYEKDLITLYKDAWSKDRILELPSPKSVRILMKELSTFYTKYCLRELSYTCIALSVYLKKWIDGEWWLI